MNDSYLFDSLLSESLLIFINTRISTIEGVLLFLKYFFTLADYVTILSVHIVLTADRVVVIVTIPVGT